MDNETLRKNIARLVLVQCIGRNRDAVQTTDEYRKTSLVWNWLHLNEMPGGALRRLLRDLTNETQS